MVIILLSSCTKKENEVGKSTNSDFYYSKITLPENFNIDSIKTFDKNKNTKTYIYIPISNNINLDSEIKKNINNKKNEFLKKVDENIESGFYSENLENEFIVTPISISKKNNLLSYCFTTSYYISSAPHEMNEFLTYNYDKLNKKLLEFNDVFSIKTKEDSVNFKKIITEKINRNGIKLYKVYNLKFNFDKDYIYFNFSDYEIASYGEGLIRVKFEKNELKNFLKINL